MKLRAVLGLTLCILLVAGLAVSGMEIATVAAVNGSVTADPGGRELGVGDELSQGDVVTVATGARITVSFADGASMDVTGPARFRLTELYDTARTVDLFQGTVNRLVVKDIVIGVRTPLDSFVAARNSTVFVGIVEAPNRTNVTYMLLEGEDAKVVDHGQIRVLGQDTPIVVDLTPGEPAEPVEPASRRVTGESAEFRLGLHTVTVIPKDGFLVEELPDGGLRLTRSGDGFGMVLLDGETAFYVYTGEYVQLDAVGNVTGHDGIVHIWAPLNRQGIYDEPVEGPASASFTGTKVK